MLGIGPISTRELGHEAGKNFNLVKIEAVKRLLEKELKFNGDELEAMIINETMISAKGDGVVYCAFDDMQDIQEIQM